VNFLRFLEDNEGIVYLFLIGFVAWLAVPRLFGVFFMFYGIYNLILFFLKPRKVVM